MVEMVNFMQCTYIFTISVMIKIPPKAGKKMFWETLDSNKSANMTLCSISVFECRTIFQKLITDVW